MAPVGGWGGGGGGGGVNSQWGCRWFRTGRGLDWIDGTSFVCFVHGVAWTFSMTYVARGVLSAYRVLTCLGGVFFFLSRALIIDLL